ncbi:MAG: regulatory protein GemA [Magnetococcales bacterium]|nr:regulatory protein GemA [Magnetococcales bacterium]
MLSREMKGKIKMAQKELKLDDGQYRQMLLDRYGVDSSTKMSFADALDLLAHFKKLGWKPRPPKEAEQPGPPAGRRPQPREGNEAMVAKIAAMLKNAGRLGQGAARLAYADGIARHMFFGGDLDVQVWVEWLERWQLVKVIQALEFDAKRVLKRANDA